MKRFLMILMIALTSLSLLAATAEAKRFGGGSSVGKQRTMTPQAAPTKAPTAAPAPSAAPAAAPAGTKWLGPLAGLAIGAGLGAMFAGGGLGGAMGGAIGNILMLLLAGVAIMFAISFFRKKQTQPAMPVRVLLITNQPLLKRKPNLQAARSMPLLKRRTSLPIFRWKVFCAVPRLRSSVCRPPMIART
jgi:hypothetical protein